MFWLLGFLYLEAVSPIYSSLIQSRALCPLEHLCGITGDNEGKSQ